MIDIANEILQEENSEPQDMFCQNVEVPSDKRETKMKDLENVVSNNNNILEETSRQLKVCLTRLKTEEIKEFSKVAFCTLCQKDFSTKKSFTSHIVGGHCHAKAMLKEDFYKMKSVTCVLCQLKFLNISSYRAHLLHCARTYMKK